MGTVQQTLFGNPEYVPGKNKTKGNRFWDAMSVEQRWFAFGDFISTDKLYLEWEKLDKESRHVVNTECSLLTLDEMVGGME